jgi:hypothetical protein
MAKLSSMNKNERRKKLVKKYAGKYAKLKAIANDKSLDEAERTIARLKMAEIPRNGNPTRIRNRCEPEIPALPHSAARSGQQGPDPGCCEVELVRKTDNGNDRSSG